MSEWKCYDCGVTLKIEMVEDLYEYYGLDALENRNWLACPLCGGDDLRKQVDNNV